MRKSVWTALLGAGSLLACGGSAQATRHSEASAGSSTLSPSENATGGASGATSAGASGAAGEALSASRVHLGPGSWDVTGTVEFALTVDGATMTIGRNGELFTAPAQIVDGAYLATDVDLPIAYSGLDRRFAKELRFVGVDTDGDGEADHLTASATLEPTIHVTGDTARNETPTVELSAVPDQTAPTLNIYTDGWAVWNSLSSIDFSASEPLAPDTAITLAGATNLSLSDASDRSLGAVIHFGTSRILPFGGTWQLDAHGNDLAGHALKIDPITLHTFADPGVLAQDGFEGDLTGVIGTTSLVTGRGSLPALSGAHSLWTESDVTIHLKRSGAETHLHFIAQAFLPSSNVFSRSALAGVVGGSHVITLTATPEVSSGTQETGDPQYPSAGSVVRYDAVLDEPGEDVILQISDGPCLDPDFVWCSLKQRLGWLIDDLTID